MSTKHERAGSQITWVVVGEVSKTRDGRFNVLVGSDHYTVLDYGVVVGRPTTYPGAVELINRRYARTGAGRPKSHGPMARTTC